MASALSSRSVKEKANCVACLYLKPAISSGTSVSTLYHGIPVYQIANLLGFDASTLGNHEFDYGWRRVQEFGRIAKFPVFSANIMMRTENRSPASLPDQTRRRDPGCDTSAWFLETSRGTSLRPSEVGPWKVLPVVDTVRKYAAGKTARSLGPDRRSRTHSDDEEVKRS